CGASQSRNCTACHGVDTTKGETGRTYPSDHFPPWRSSNTRPAPNPASAGTKGPEVHTCSWFTSNSQPQCAAPAPHQTRAPPPLYGAPVWFCTEHKALQEANFARRNARIPGQRRADQILIVD